MLYDKQIDLLCTDIREDADKLSDAACGSDENTDNMLELVEDIRSLCDRLEELIEE